MRSKLVTRLFFSIVALLAPLGCTNTVVNAGNTKACGACVATTDCVAHEECSLLTGGAFCAPTCSTNSDCGSGLVCGEAKSSESSTVHVCQTASGSCSGSSGNPDAGNGAPDSGNNMTLDSGNNMTPDSGMGSSCPGYVAPDETGGNCPCQSGHTCAANNCYGGFYCELSNNRCVAQPSNCSDDTDAGMTTNDAGMMAATDAGPFTSNVTSSGGTESQLYFAVVGDTRPYTQDDTSHYPATPPLPACTTSTDGYVGTSNAATCGAITKIFQDIQGLSPSPPLVISTGDYQYVTPGRGGASTQLGYYQTARAFFTGVEWPAMGNHECDGYTAGNCANGCPSGDSCSGSNTENFLQYQSTFLQPIGETLPYYSRTLTATDGSWTAHFIIIAPNYWNSTQQSWLTSQLSAAGTSSTSNYIFVIHHEDATAGNPSSLNTIESAERNVETVSIVGHSHEWNHGGSNPKELLVGNGGVPSSSARNLGFTTITRQPNGQLQIKAYDFMTLQVVEQYTVTP